MVDEDNAHALAPLLEERLSELGLDAETYSLYILPLLTGANEDAVDEDEWESVMELLQASSESHSDDDSVWIALRRDVQAAWQAHLDELEQKSKQEIDKREHELTEQLERERQIAKEAAEAEGLVDKSSAQPEVDDAAKRALLSRFAYDVPDDEEEAPVTNKELAKKIHTEKAAEVRSQFKTTKKEEQQKSKEARQKKIQDKEDRQKRAAKGERKR